MLDLAAAELVLDPHFHSGEVHGVLRVEFSSCKTTCKHTNQGDDTRQEKK